MLQLYTIIANNHRLRELHFMTILDRVKLSERSF